jgi:regulator of cell morphogenesis and NO signaling
MTEITSNMTINEAIKINPEVMKVFNKYGLDTCCGGHQMIEDSAKLYGAEIQKLMEELKNLTVEKN